jgi:hypothetical protein
MEFRTTFKIEPSGRKINYHTPVMLTGSCFAGNIGEKMQQGKMKVLVNPSGTLFNPFSVAADLEQIIDKRKWTENDLVQNGKRWISFSHYTSFTSDTAGELLERINLSVSSAHDFLRKASFLFITFGTASVYTLKKTGQVVANCHRLPASNFVRTMASPEEISGRWGRLINKLFEFNPGISVIFTVSPVRHWSDGAHANQLSKSILFLATEAIISSAPRLSYFPAYELLMDDLRDYRFYSSDMIHPSQDAVDYIWDAFSASYIGASDLDTWRELRKITAAVSHRPVSESVSSRREFAAAMIKSINKMAGKYPEIDLSAELAHFKQIL